MDQAQARRGRKEQSTDTEKSRHAQDETRKKSSPRDPALKGTPGTLPHTTPTISSLLFFNLA